MTTSTSHTGPDPNRARDFTRSNTDLVAVVKASQEFAASAAKQAFVHALVPAGSLQLVGILMVALTLVHPITPVPPLAGAEFITVILAGSTLMLVAPVVLVLGPQRARAKAADTAMSTLEAEFEAERHAQRERERRNEGSSSL